MKVWGKWADPSPRVFFCKNVILKELLVVIA